MPENKTMPYEAMFLISQSVAADLNGVVEHINEILAKGDAEVIAMKKWDERRLAFEIDKQKRGVYILCYFNAPTDGVARIERECNLSERIMRMMVLRADHLSEDEMRAADAREELAVEAKLRAEKATRADERSQSKVTVGAPPQEEAAEGEAPQEAKASAEPAEQAPATEPETADTNPA